MPNTGDIDSQVLDDILFNIDVDAVVAKAKEKEKTAVKRTSFDKAAVLERCKT